MATQTYLVALGGNRWGLWGSPRRLLRALVAAGGLASARVVAASRSHASSPLGPGTRTYANAVVVVETGMMPLAFLAHLKSVERAYGRRPGRRWGDRVLDLDIIGWSGGRWSSRVLTIPHPAFRTRRFVLVPLVDVAPGWRDPVTGLTPRHLLARAERRRPEYSSRA